MWVAAAVRKIVPARMRAAREQQQARPTDWQKHSKQSQCHEATSHAANPEQCRPCRKQCSTACAPHFKTQCLANAAHREHCKTKGLADAACRRHAETQCYANVAGRGHRQVRRVCAHRLSTTVSHRSHAARKASTGSRKPGCPACESSSPNM